MAVACVADNRCRAHGDGWSGLLGMGTFCLPAQMHVQKLIILHLCMHASQHGLVCTLMTHPNYHVDLQILSWTNTLGIQIFGPLTILAMAVCMYLPAPPDLLLLVHAMCLKSNCLLPNHSKQAQQMSLVWFWAVLPINLQGNRIDQASDPHHLATANYHAATSTFAKLTLSNLEKGSQLYWCTMLSPLYLYFLLLHLYHLVDNLDFMWQSHLSMD